MSDTETKNLLEDAIEDEEESDLEDSKTLSSDLGRTSKPIQVLIFLCFKRRNEKSKLLRRDWEEVGNIRHPLLLRL